MKKLIITSFVLISFSSFGQIQLIPKKPKPTMDFLNIDLSKQKMNLPFSPKATLTGRSAFGKMYALPLDNMPCIVPDVNLIKPIPNRGMSGFQNSLMMPNPFKQEDIIPAQ